jgi:hypothetical protein
VTWVPTSAEEVERAVEAGSLVETHTFDAKRELPAAGRNRSLATDVAAMTVDGGVLLYGVGEDGEGRLSEKAPLELAGARERVDQIIASLIDQSPAVEINALPLTDDPARGYLVVVVPQSSMAPHQVMGSDMRFYGRGETGNRVLSEGDVARLYDRRRRWEADAAGLLEAEIARAPFEPQDGLAYLHGFARPVAADDSTLDRIIAQRGQPGLLNLLTDAAHGVAEVARGYSPTIHEAASWSRRGALGWRLTTDPTEERDTARYTAQLDIDNDGTTHLFVGRAGEARSQTADGVRAPALFEPLIAGNLSAMLSTAGQAQVAAGLLGPLDVGVAITNLDGATAYSRVGGFPIGFNMDEYRRTDRRTARELAGESDVVAVELVRRLLDVIAPGLEPLDPTTT